MRQSPRPQQPSETSRRSKDDAVLPVSEEMIEDIKRTYCPSDPNYNLDCSTEAGHSNLVNFMTACAALLMAATAMRASNIKSTRPSTLALRWADRTQYHADGIDLHQRRIRDFSLGHSLLNSDVYMGSTDDLQRPNGLSAAAEYAQRSIRPPFTHPDLVIVGNPTDKSHRYGRRSQEFYLDASSCQEHTDLCRILGTLARKAHWSKPDQLFFSCPVRTGTLARRYCIRSSDLSQLAKITATKHGVGGTMAPKSFKRCGMNRKIITDGVNVDELEAKLESRHTSKSAYNRYLLSMTGPPGVSSLRVATTSSHKRPHLSS